MNLTAVYVPYANVRPASWRTTHTFKPELKLVTQSLRDLGWVQPIVARLADGAIIDGFARWVAAQNDKVISKRDGGMVPVVWVDCDEVDAMLHHVRLNRARGQVIARPLSRLLSTALASGKYGREEVRQILGMTTDEFDMLREPELLISKTVREHTYSRAWIPIEAPPVDTVVANGSVAPVARDIVIERPPNKDR
jgi:hypothetical protein